MVGIYTTSDGRQDMYQTFNQGPSYLQSELLRHGELAWLTRNTYFGDQRNYAEMDIDDTFTADDAWNATTTPGSIDHSDANALRMNPGDVATTANWENANNFRVDQLFNMGGSVNYAADNTAAPGTDPLLAAFQASCTSACGPANAGANKSYANSFGWISHTYDTPYLDVGCATQNYIEAELNENTNAAHTDLGLTESTDPTVALGAENPDVFVPSNHSGFADLVPGNPATVDPPDLDTDLTTVNGRNIARWKLRVCGDRPVHQLTHGRSVSRLRHGSDHCHGRDEFSLALLGVDLPRGELPRLPRVRGVRRDFVQMDAHAARLGLRLRDGLHAVLGDPARQQLGQPDLDHGSDR